MNALIARTEQQLAARRGIDDLEASLFKEIGDGRMEQTLYDGASDKGDDQCDHLFADGVYGRGLWIPAGTVVVGKLHKQSRICVVAYGHCLAVDEHRPEGIEIHAPWFGEFKGGSKTAVTAFTDTFWIAFTGTDLKDPKEILDTLAAKDHAEYERWALRLEKTS